MGLPCRHSRRQDGQIHGRVESQTLFLTMAPQATGVVPLCTTVTAVFRGFFRVVGLTAKFRQEAGDFLALVSAVAARGNAVCSYSSGVTPAPQGVGMDMEEPGYFPHR